VAPRRGVGLAVVTVIGLRRPTATQNRETGNGALSQTGTAINTALADET
jgi:hypothetical protein